MTDVVRHLRALLGSTVQDFFVEDADTGYWNDNNESIIGTGAGGGSAGSRGDERGADMPDFIGDEELLDDEFAASRGGGILYVCSPTGYMEDTI